MDKAHKELIAYHKLCKAKIDKRMTFTGEFGYWQDHNNHSLGDVSLIILCYDHDPFIITKRGSLALFPHQSKKDNQGTYLEPVRDEYFYYTRNPLLCGTRLLSLALAMEEGAIRFANSHQSIITAAHLYNGLQQQGLLNLKWPELEEMIKIQMPNMFFTTPPTQAGAAHKVYMLRFGQSLADYSGVSRRSDGSFHLGRDATTTSKKSRWDASCLTISKASSSLGMYFEGKETLVRTVHALKIESEKLLKRPKAINNFAGKHEDTEILQFLAELRPWLEKNWTVVGFDYIELTEQCEALLTSLVDSKVLEGCFWSAIETKSSIKATKQGKKDKKAYDAALAAVCEMTERFSLVRYVLWNAKEREEVKDRKGIILLPTAGEQIAPVVTEWLENHVKGPGN